MLEIVLLVVMCLFVVFVLGFIVVIVIWILCLIIENIFFGSIYNIVG